jgi:glycosyltransferase involved in cell wall biosynthesis
VRVVIDARSAIGPRRTGIGHYARALLRFLPLAGPESQFVAWYLDMRGAGRTSARFAGWAPNLTERASRFPSRIFGRLSNGVGYPKLEWLAGRFDLLLAANFIPPPTSSTGLVMVVHDLAFDVMPETAPHNDERWRRQFDRWLGRAAAVIVPSDAVRTDLLRFHDVDPEHVSAIHHGTDVEMFSPAKPVQVEEIRRRYRIDGPYVLLLGGFEPRKNLERLVQAYGLLEDQRVSLVLAGGAVPWARQYTERVEHAITQQPAEIRDRIVCTGYVPNADRRGLLSGAEILAYPSRYEGFGFPILEGFAANVPVLTSNVSSMPEIAGGAAVLVDPEDVQAIASGLNDLLHDDDLRNVLRAAGTARVASFTWERCARETLAVLERAHERERGELDDIDG